MAIQAQMYPDNLGLPLGGGSPDWFSIDNNDNNFFNGGGLNGLNDLNELGFNLLQQKQQQFQFQQQQQYLAQLQNLQQRNQTHIQNQCVSSDNGFVFLKNNNNNATSTTASTTTTTASSDHMPVNFSQNLAAQLEKQRQEIDRYISLQNERLKVAIQNQRNQQLTTILRKLEEKAMVMLKQKDEEISKARNRAMELEQIMKKMEMEKQAWQRVAAENESMVISLNNTLEQLKEQQIQQQQQACYNDAADDAESCCDDNDFESGRVTGSGPDGRVCRVCRSRNACMLLLPCRHLCSCKDCEVFLDACPLCKSPKKASFEALFS